MDVHTADDFRIVEQGVYVGGVAILHAVHSRVQVGRFPQQEPAASRSHVGVHDHAAIRSIDRLCVPEVVANRVIHNRDNVAAHGRVKVHQVFDAVHGVAPDLVELGIDSDFIVVKILEGAVTVVLLQLDIVDTKLRENGSHQPARFIQSHRVVTGDVICTFEREDISLHVGVVYVDGETAGNERLHFVVYESL